MRVGQLAHMHTMCTAGVGIVILNRLCCPVMAPTITLEGVGR